MKEIAVLVLVLGLGSACAGSPPPDAAQATARFASCLERSGVVAEDVAVELDDDGTVRTISLVVLSEGDVAYEPTIRLACTEEVETAIANE